MSVNRNDFLSCFPEFDCDQDRKVDLFVSFAERRIDRDVWGDCADEACLYLTAHLLASSGGAGGPGGGVAGPITSESVGNLSRSYGQINFNSQGNDELFAITKYGQLFLNLRRSCIVSSFVTCQSVPGTRNGLT